MNEQRSRTDERCRPTSFFHEHAWRERKKQRNPVPFLRKAYLYTPILLFIPFIIYLFSFHSCWISSFFKFLQLPHSRRLRLWCCPFLPSHTLGTSLREWHGSGLARRKPNEYLPESVRADSPAWLTSLVANPKRTPLNDGCRL